MRTVEKKVYQQWFQRLLSEIDVNRKYTGRQKKFEVVDLERTWDKAPYTTGMELYHKKEDIVKYGYYIMTIKPIECSLPGLGL